MRIPDSKHQAIAVLLERYIADPRPWGLADIAAAQQALPIYAGWTGTTFLRIDGQFFTLDQDDRPGEFLAELNEQWQIASLTTAARRESSLLQFLPDRPIGAPDCTFCEGAGVHLLGEKQVDFTCGECAGLGWIDVTLNQRAT
ncbi:MAG TPA: hypothetical protein VNN08_00670 [Thermoanaerobaculia bacterium]|nr:hypothetical protein [Thermoanaerobaculia bacterium]